MITSNGKATMVANGQTTQELAQQLTLMLDKPVVDKTGLAGSYDFKLNFERDGTLEMGGLPAMAAAIARAGRGSPVSSDPTTPINGDDLGGGPTLQGAIEKQLGLNGAEETDSGDCGDRSRGKSADRELPAKWQWAIGAFAAR